ncbi:MAG: TetR/AcrR family transcriptional regulator, partial [Acidimicrobiales bacterium]
GTMTENRRRSVLQPGETPRTRGERTRQRVAEALIELVGEGDMSPTAKSVAERAGVSVRLVFHHFEDMDALYRLAVGVQDERHWAEVREVPADAPLAERVDRTIQQRLKLFEAVSPVRQSLVPVLSRNAELASVVARGEQRLRGLLESTFATELRRDGRGKKELLDALDAITSWEAWDRLRRRQQLAPTAARKVVTRTLMGLLAP